MKNLILLISLIFSSQLCIAQSLALDSCGLDSKSVLNKSEAAYFNEILKKKRDNFDFTNKNVAFAYGNFGRGLISKKEYFDRWGKDYYSRSSRVDNQLMILTKEEKEISGGYDAIIISWSKIGFNKRTRKKLINNLRKNDDAG